MTLITGLDLQGGDNSSRLQQVIENAPQDTKLELPAGMIRCEQMIWIKKQKFKLSGQGPTTQFYRKNFSTDRNLALFHVLEGNDVSLTDFKYTGTNPYPGDADQAYDPNIEGQHGIEIEAGSRVFLSRLALDHLWGDGIYIRSSYLKHILSQDIYTTDCIFTNIGRQGCTVVGGKNIVFTRGIYHLIRHACWDLEPLKATQDWQAKNVHMFGNLLGTHRLLALASKGAGPNVGDVVFRNNLQLNTTKGFMQIFLGSSTPDQRTGFWIIDNGSLHAPIANTIKIQRLNNVFIARNNIPTQDTPGMEFITANYCDYLYHKDNKYGPCPTELTGTAYTEGHVYLDPPPTPSFIPYL